MDDTYKYA